MPQAPEAKARQTIDHLLQDAGWIVQDRSAANNSAGRGVAIREFPLISGHGEADYLLFVESMALGVIEAKKEGSTLTGFEIQTPKYSVGLPAHLHVPRRPLPRLAHAIFARVSQTVTKSIFQTIQGERLLKSW